VEGNETEATRETKIEKTSNSVAEPRTGGSVTTVIVVGYYSAGVLGVGYARFLVHRVTGTGQSVQKMDKQRTAERVLDDRLL